MNVSGERPGPRPRWRLRPLGETGWRICDDTRGEHDPAHLVAYVDRDGFGALNVIWLRSPCPSRRRFHDLGELLSALESLGDVDPLPGSTRPVPIPHLPPATG